jgi:NAD+ kinase
VSARSSKRPPRVPKVLVVYKKSAYQTNVKERRSARFMELIDKGDESVMRMLEAHREHVETIEEARAALDALGCRSIFRFRGDEGLVEDIDLLVTVGGDGTLLWAARWVGGSTPVVAINSAPHDSVGHFCAGIKGHVREALEAALEGSLRETKLTRLEVQVDEEVVTRRVLNDALFSHASPAATTRYLLRLTGSEGLLAEEDHKSSGLWVGPAAGSTAAIRSAGGKVLPIGSKRVQYVVREPYVAPASEFRMVRGLVEPGEELEVVNKTRDARLFFDGPHHVREVRMGSRVRFRRSEESLCLLGFREARAD